jgi:hypothetical protein
MRVARVGYRIGAETAGENTQEVDIEADTEQRGPVYGKLLIELGSRRRFN